MNDRCQHKQAMFKASIQLIVRRIQKQVRARLHLGVNCVRFSEFHCPRARSADFTDIDLAILQELQQFPEPALDPLRLRLTDIVSLLVGQLSRIGLYPVKNKVWLRLDMPNQSKHLLRRADTTLSQVIESMQAHRCPEKLIHMVQNNIGGYDHD